MTTGAIRPAAIRSAAAMPSSTGIFTSRITRSGRSSSASSIARAPSAACPTTSYPSSASISARSIRISASSSAITTRRGSGVVTGSGYPGPVRPLRSGRLAPPGRVGGTADAMVSNTIVRKDVWVQIPHPAPLSVRTATMRAMSHIRPPDVVASALAASDRGVPDAENAATHGVAVKTIRRWRRLYQRQQLPGDRPTRVLPARAARGSHSTSPPMPSCWGGIWATDI